jgi:DNA (cytosine-5)-methyltransferase 1
MTTIDDIKTDQVPKRLKMISTFTGAGGMDIGFYKAGFDPIWANDIDPFAIKTYNNFFKSDHGVVGNIREQDIPNNEKIDLVIGGPPCQGFSVAGKMDPNDPRSKHVWDFLGVVKKIQPTVFVMENVKALAVNRRWNDLRKDLIDSARELGYETELWVLNASDYNVPQSRERMFLVGSLKGKKITPPKPVSDKMNITIKNTLKNIPRFNSPGNNTICTAIITPAKNPILRQSPYAGMLFNGQGRPLNLDHISNTLPASMGGNRTPIIDQSSLEKNEENWVINYHKKLMDGGKPVNKIPKRLRRITTEEATVIQTFPYGMEFAGSITTKFRQIGNAVPVELAYFVGKKIYNEII